MAASACGRAAHSFRWTADAMPRFAANLTMLFTELPIEARFKAARDAGFGAVEILFPYDLPAKILSRAALAAGTEILLINCPPPNWAGGPRGFAAEPGMEERFRRDFDRALRVAQALRAKHIHVMAGKGDPDDPVARQTMIDNLDWACDRAPHASLLIEPINRGDMPDYFLCDFDQAADIIAAVGASNLGLQFDAYHAQIITGDAIGTLTRHRPLIRHVQIAGLPARNEPFSGGGLDMPALFAALDDGGYAGWVSAEYRPARLTESGLGWLPRDQDRATTGP